MCHMKLRLNIWPDMQIQYEFQTLYDYHVYELTNNRITNEIMVRLEILFEIIS